MKILGFNVTRNRSLEKIAAVSGGGQGFGVPPAWMNSIYGPQQPIYPMFNSGESEVPRTIDYPIAVNAQLTPRSGYGLMPFSQIMLAYEKVPECRFPVNLIQRQLSAYVPKLVDKKQNVIKDHPYSWMTAYPDGNTPFSVWMTRYLKSAKIYDAPALYFGRDGADICSMHFIDGSTLFVIVDEYGNTPMPERVQDYVTRRVQEESYPTPPPKSYLIPGSAKGPVTVDKFIEQYNQRFLSSKTVPLKIPAYAQVIKGTPATWWSSDDIWYQPESRRVNAPYGEPFIEAAWPWVMICVNLTAFELAHYRTGNMPEGYVTLPRDWLATPDQLEALEIAFNQRMTRNPVTERNRIRLFPDGSKWFQTKRGDWPETLYDRARGNILDEVGIPPAEAGDIPGKGLGGKGFKEGGTVELTRNTINPNRMTITMPFNYVLEHDGVTDVSMVLDPPISEINPDQLKNAVYEGMAHGTYSLNEGRALINLQPIGDTSDPNNLANKHLIVAGAAIYVIEDMKESAGTAQPNFGGGKAGGPPENPVEKAVGFHTREDYTTLEAAMHHVEENGTLDGKNYFLVKMPAADHPRDSKGRWVEGPHDDGKTQGENEAPKVFHTPGGAHRQLAQAKPLAEHLPDNVNIEGGLRPGGIGPGALGEKTEPAVDNTPSKDFGTEALSRDAKENRALRDEADKYQSDQYNKQSANWTEDEKHAIEDYAWAEPCYHINGQARGTLPSTEYGQERIQALDSMLSKSTLENATTVYRGIDAQGMKQLGNLEVGDTFSDKAFVSTSMYAPHAVKFTHIEDDEPGAALFKMDLPAGTHAAHTYDTAPEVLLARNSKFEVTKVTTEPRLYSGEMTMIKMYHLRLRGQ